MLSCRWSATGFPAPLAVLLVLGLSACARIIESGPEALTRIGLIGNDMQLIRAAGACGMEGQSVPVGVGQATLRLEGLTVGGTA